MTIREAKTILTEFNKWRRAEPPYDGDNPDNYRGCPHSPKEIGEAIDTLVDTFTLLIDGKMVSIDKACDAYCKSQCNRITSDCRLCRYYKAFRNYLLNNE